jgi:hypothetical protein
MMAIKERKKELKRKPKRESKNTLNKHKKDKAKK